MDSKCHTLLEEGERIVSRRSLLRGAVIAAGGLLLPLRPLRANAYELPGVAADAAKTSPLVYVSPLKGDGAESTCHGEVWFVADGNDLLVVTGQDRWKATAIRKGLDRARLWVGDHGVWTRSRERFKQSPTFLANARLDGDSHERALTAFAAKYPAEWDKWGPRFRKGLADGSRVLIRYAPDAP